MKTGSLYLKALGLAKRQHVVACEVLMVGQVAATVGGQPSVRVAREGVWGQSGA